jgi:hypothetical protein
MVEHMVMTYDCTAIRHVFLQISVLTIISFWPWLSTHSHTVFVRIIQKLRILYLFLYYELCSFGENN